MTESQIIEKWLQDTYRNTPLLDIVSKKSSIETTPTGKWYIRKSKWKLINWWRKLTDTEKKEQEYTYKWKLPDNGTDTK